MSTGKWKRDPRTGTRLSLVKRVDETYLSSDGHLDIEKIFGGKTYELTNVRSIANTAGLGYRYLVNSVMPAEGCPIHTDRQRMYCQDTGSYLFTLFATMVNSAQAGGEMWRMRMAGARSIKCSVASLNL